MLKAVKEMEMVAMMDAMEKIADGKVRFASQIAEATGLTYMEVGNNFRNLVHDEQTLNKWGCFRSRFNTDLANDGCAKDTNSLLINTYKVTEEEIRITKTFAELDKKGNIIPGTTFTTTRKKTGYKVVKR